MSPPALQIESCYHYLDCQFMGCRITMETNLCETRKNFLDRLIDVGRSTLNVDCAIP